eukprot:CAMPEP_0172495914 /NCGR_PEP_ID=MMETSP1066-20121228/79723_1 /TAXON_ID=671091 /ORGANISM="Coscinodiscus wailesii, Strain CCMP2513" /LENGTH=224 /DNA_ID=CAMNT_0013267927 /DNA_START=49 /DNA_END=723 /DNA_ORIENTATION=-
MPPVLTFAARVSDGLPLVSSFASSQEVLEEHKRQAKQILRDGVGSSSVAKMSIETSGRKTFHYLIKDNVCYLTLTESSYPKRLSFLYLEEVSNGFIEELKRDYGDQWRYEIERAARPYQFIKTDQFIQRKQREFVDPTSRQNSSKLNDDLADIHSIMKKNIQEVLNRGEKLETVADTSRNLVDQSKQFKWGAKKLTLQAMINQYAPLVAITLFTIFVLYVKFFM